MVEYKVRPVIRYIVTSFESNEHGTASGVLFEVDNEYAATRIKTALEHLQLMEPSCQPLGGIPMKAV